MVCIAAFIILAFVGVIVAFISIFKRDVGRSYLRVLKKSWGCVGKKIRLQKCETNFKEDVKHSILKKFVLTHPHALRPLSILIEALAVLIVLIVVWAILTAIKSLLALWTFGTCNVSQPSSCALSSEACSIDGDEPSNIIEATGRWFTEWGEIFQAIPDRLHDWHAQDYAVKPYAILGTEDLNRPYALDIFDPGCSACMQSFRNQQKSGFFEKYNTILMPYAIELPDGPYKFKNSGIVVRYLHASTLAGTDAASYIIEQIYTKSNDKGVNYQSVINNELDESGTEHLIQSWLKASGLSESKVTAVVNLVRSDQVNKMMQQVSDIINNHIHAKGIPTLIYDNKLHTGLYEAK